MKIVICAVPFSPNLGDGAIFESIKSRYQLLQKDSKVIPLDIAGRTDYQISRPKLNRLQSFPKPLRRYLVLGYCIIKYLTTWRKSWKTTLQDSDIITVGGGQLFLDEELNFPIKLYLLSRQIKPVKSRKNIAFVGVSSDFTILGKLLLKRALKNINPDSISVRDSNSKRNIINILGIKNPVSIVPDPALYSEEIQIQKDHKPLKNHVSICISNPQSLDAENKLGEVFHQRPADFYGKLIKALNSNGMIISIFSNGAPEDEKLKTEVHNKNKEIISNCHPTPTKPSELYNIISTSNMIVAHRLHANIIAYSLGVPSIGLNWDDKVESFFSTTERMELYIKEIPPPIENIIKAVKAANTLNLTFSHNSLNMKIEEEIKTHIQEV